MIIVTGGSAYADIDVYASAVAYAELLRAQGKPAVAVSTAPFSGSVPADVRAWPAEFATEHTPNPDDRFVVVDVSDPAHFDKIVDHAKLAEVIDHHTGFEDYWDEHVGVDSQIEF